MNLKRSLKSVLLLGGVASLGACSFGTGGGGASGSFLPGDGLPKNRHYIDIASVGDAEPKAETLSKTGNKPYTVFGQNYQPMRSAQGYDATGMASWYGTKFHGRKTSSGTPYDMYAMSAAHRTLPLPSYVRVTNLNNQRSVIVKVNDRGPFVDTKNRLIDLSYVAAAKLGLVATGTAKVRVQAVQAQDTANHSNNVNAVITTAMPNTASLPKAQPNRLPAQAPITTLDSSEASYLQMGAFSVRHNAQQLFNRLTQVGVAAYLEESGGLFKVKSGPYIDADQALQQKLEIDRLLNIEARVVFE